MTNKESQPASKEYGSWKEHTSGISSVSVFLADSEGRLLMVRDVDANGGRWGPITGYIDDLDREEPEDAILREAKEELGLDVELTGVLATWYYHGEDGEKPWSGKPNTHVGFAYTGEILGGTFTPQPEEIQEWRFFTPEEVLQLYREGNLKTPVYNYTAFMRWIEGRIYPLDMVMANGRITRLLEPRFTMEIAPADHTGTKPGSA